MKNLIIVLLLPYLLFAWDFTQERDLIPVEFDGVSCQVPWTTGYNYINPTFCDLDGDGDFDLIMGSDWNRITYVRNSGDLNNAQFDFMTDSLVNILFPEPSSQLSCCPAFCDIDNDDDFDLILGGVHRLFFYINSGSNQNPILLLEEEYFQSISLDGDQYPFLVDIDGDMDFDMFLGKGYLYTPTAGRLYYYCNEGIPDSASMVLVSDQFEGIDLGYYAIPAFCDIDNDGDYDMFLGDEDGLIHYYRNDGSPEVYDFTEVTSNYADVNVANIASPVFCDIDNDGDYDLFVGERSWGQDNRRGDINFYENVGTPDSASFELVTQNFLAVDIGIQPRPAFADIDNDGLLDMFLGDSDGNINYFSNIGSEEDPCFTLSSDTFQGIWATYQSRPNFGDIDADNDLDLMIGRASFGGNSIHYYRNEGTPEIPDYRLMTDNFLGIDYMWPSPFLVDIDNDLDLDLFVGHGWNQVVFWENIGTPEFPQFELNTMDFLNTPYIGDFCPICFGDIDNDGDYDLIRGHYDYTLDLYLNIGNPEYPNLVLEEEEFLDIFMTLNPEPFLTDIDNDGDLDLFVGDFCGGVSFWRNNEISNMVDKTILSPYDFSLGQNYPNPFNVTTTIPFTLDRALPVRVVVYNGLGQCVATLIDGQMSSGQHQLRWDAGMYSSGVYLIALESESIPSQARKVMLIK